MDDHEPYARNVARDFGYHDIQAYVATRYDEALRLCAEHHPDLAIVDLFLMPPEDGLSLVKALKAIDPSVITILVSAHMSVAHAVMGIRAGADDVFLKPFAAKQALARVAGAPPLLDDERLTLEQIEWEHIARTLQDYDGNITRAAEALGVFRQSLQRKMRRHIPRGHLTAPVGPTGPAGLDDDDVEGDDLEDAEVEANAEPTAPPSAVAAPELKVVAASLDVPDAIPAPARAKEPSEPSRKPAAPKKAPEPPKRKR